MGLLHWLNTPKPWLRTPRCPLCGRETVGDLGYVRDWSLRTRSAPTYREVKVAHCPVHGHKTPTHYHFPRRPDGKARLHD